MKFPTFIFDLDGVITNTEEFHFLAWKIISAEFNYHLTLEKNEELKGVSRSMCLDKILKWANTSIDSLKYNDILERKNKLYLDLISKLNSNNILGNVYDFIVHAKKENHVIALYSSSKNAKHILNKLGLTHFFDVIVDGNSVKKSKPDPEGFIMASELTNTKPEDCVVFEDSSAGIKAGNAINMFTVGIGKSKELKIANQVYSGFNEIKLKMFQK
jgi:beta-phosphoglucomutase|tara:strand:+ start:9905 stop:10549 length:645 start_codon:yes stop_codon:yes gene_type:complete